jgi:hypothetical protein
MNWQWVIPDFIGPVHPWWCEHESCNVIAVPGLWRICVWVPGPANLRAAWALG